jgi:hypothetical protein
MVAGLPGQAVTAAHIVEAFTALKLKYPAVGKYPAAQALFDKGRSYAFKHVDDAYIQFGVFRQSDEYNSRLGLPVSDVSEAATPVVGRCRVDSIKTRVDAHETKM